MGNSRAGARMRVTGDLSAPAFLDWIAHRAGVLDLSGWARPTTDGAIDLRLTGAPALLDAMEVACSLGPAACLVDAVERGPAPPDDSLRAFRILPAEGA